MAVMCFTGNEMFPRTNFEIALASFLILNAYLINGTIFGQMAELIKVINKNSNMYTKQIDNANTAMGKIMLPQKLHKDIREYLVASQSKMD